MSVEDLVEVESWVQQTFGHQTVDRVWAYEMLQAGIESWRSSEIAWTNQDYDKLGKVTEKADAVSSAASKILLGIGKPNVDDLFAIESAYRKFGLLNKAWRPFRMTREEALRDLAEWESRRG